MKLYSVFNYSLYSTVCECVCLCETRGTGEGTDEYSFAVYVGSVRERPTSHKPDLFKWHSENEPILRFMKRCFQPALLHSLDERKTRLIIRSSSSLSAPSFWIHYFSLRINNSVSASEKSTVVRFQSWLERAIFFFFFVPLFRCRLLWTALLWLCYSHR